MGNAQKTIGEIRVRITFNPANSTLVDNIKKQCAITINYLHEGNVSMAFARAVDFGINGTSECIYNMSKPEKASVVEFERLKELALKELREVTPEMDKETAMTKVELAAMWAVKAATC